MLQCGDPTGTGTGDPGYSYGVENRPKDIYPSGTLAMARSADPTATAASSSSSTRDQLPVEGGGYSIFGRVAEGIDIVDGIAEQGIGGDARAGGAEAADLDPGRERREDRLTAAPTPATAPAPADWPSGLRVKAEVRCRRWEEETTSTV